MKDMMRKPMYISAVFVMVAGITLNVYAQTIKKDGPHLSCTLDIPTITADNANLKYNPMPFQVTLNATNCGGSKTDTVWASIIVPPDLSLAGADAPNRNTKKFLPSILVPNGTGTVYWSVKHPTQKVF